jgi:hypothetical protein
MISDNSLLETYLSSAMENYLTVKIGCNVETTRAQAAEFLKYFLIAAELSPGPIAVSEEIDNLWHFWILETSEYNKLIEKSPKRVFLHHSSNIYIEGLKKPQYPPLTDKEKSKRDISALLTYVANFGEFREDNAKYWPPFTQLMKQLGGLENANRELTKYIENMQVA